MTNKVVSAGGVFRRYDFAAAGNDCVKKAP